MGSSISGKNINKAFVATNFRSNYAEMKTAVTNDFENSESLDRSTQLGSMTKGHEELSNILHASKIETAVITASYSSAIPDNAAAGNLADLIDNKHNPEITELIADTDPKHEAETNTSSNLGK